MGCLLVDFTEQGLAVGLANGEQMIYDSTARLWAVAAIASRAPNRHFILRCKSPK